MVKHIMMITLVFFLSLVLMAPVEIIAATDYGRTIDLDFHEETNYHNILSEWKEQNIPIIQNFEHEYTFSDINAGSNPVHLSGDSHGYGSKVIEVSEDEVTIPVTVPEKGLYHFALDYYSLSDTIMSIMFSLTVNGESLFNESEQIKLDTFWHKESDEIKLDRYGNEVLPKQTQFRRWDNTRLNDSSRLFEDGLLFLLEAGENVVTIHPDAEAFLLGSFYVTSQKTLPDYSEYVSNAENKPDAMVIQPAEDITMKNSASVRPGTVRDASAIPFDYVNLKVNVLSGETYDEPGERVTYNIRVDEEGYYRLTFKTKQDIYANTLAYRTVYINGEIPFDEARRVTFSDSNRWQNVTLSDDQENPYYFYLNAGVNQISLEVNSAPYQEVYHGIQRIILDINTLTLEIKRLTGNNADPNRDWDIESFIPGVTDQLIIWQSAIAEYAEELHTINQTDDSSQDIVYLESAVKKFDKLLKEVDKLPYRLNVLSEGSGSISQLLGDAMNIMVYQPLSIDQFYVHGDEDVQNARRSIFFRAWVGIKRLVLTFFEKSYEEGADEGELEIWVNRNRQIVDVMQELADREFTDEHNVSVKFSLMPDENKLLLANAAGQGPDVAMGTHVNLAYNLAVRDSVYDLKNFSDLEEFLDVYEEPGAIIPFLHDGGLYGLPETQNFNVLFYREDILGALNLNVPETWDDVIEMLPELQRFGMNFFVPLAYINSYKTVDTTVPYIYQFGGDLYSEDGMETVIDSEKNLKAITFMTDLFTIYSLPLQVGNFYHQFRYGMLPIGVADFAVYVQLMHAAPEIENLWSIAPMPGVKTEDGINRQATGPGHGMMILQNSEMKEDAWSFIKWWMQTDVQIEFEQILTTTLGSEYMWNSANLEAFRYASWPEEHKQVLLTQWESLRNVPNTPAMYMLERELSNIWNKIVLSGENVRDAVDDSVVLINRELERKYIEFGYMDEYGNKIRAYPIADIPTVKEMMGEDDD